MVVPNAVDMAHFRFSEAPSEWAVGVCRPPRSRQRARVETLVKNAPLLGIDEWHVVLTAQNANAPQLGEIQRAPSVIGERLESLGVQSKPCASSLMK